MRRHPSVYLPRVYLLDGHEFSSKDCLGFVYTASKDLGECVACGEPVRRGEKRVRMNIFGQDEPMHLTCYLGDHGGRPIILGVRTEKHVRYGLPRTFIICKDFSREEKTVLLGNSPQ